MRRTSVILAIAVLVTACSSGGSSGSPGSPGGTGAATASFDPTAVSGPVVLSGWQSTGAEGVAVTQTMLAARSAMSKLQIKYQPIQGTYEAVMATKFSSHQPPDLFYVNADYAQQWIDQGYLAPLDDYIKRSGFDTSQFFEGYASIFKGKDGKTYGFPKDGNTIGMAYNTDIVTSPPKTMDELVTLAQSLKGKNGLKAPLCLNPGLDRGLAFLYAQGGSLLSDDGKTDQVDSDKSKAAIQWYMDLFKNGLGLTASDMGDGWCGDALGKKHSAITFEGGWLDPAMTSTYPDTKYTWAPMPTGSSGSPVTISFTVCYAIGADSANKDQAFALLTWLTGKEGMTKWTSAGIALPSRKDVPSPQGKDVLTAESAYAKPGSGFMPGWPDVQKAFQDAFTAQLQSKAYDAGPVITATKAAIDKALSS